MKNVCCSLLDAFSKKQCSVFTIESPPHCLFCSLCLSHTIGRGFISRRNSERFFMQNNGLFAALYSPKFINPFAHAAAASRRPTGLKQFFGVEYLLIKLSCALYLSYALFTKIKEPTHIKVSSSLLRFLTRKRTGYGAEPRRKRVRGGATKKDVAGAARRRKRARGRATEKEGTGRSHEKRRCGGSAPEKESTGQSHGERGYGAEPRRKRGTGQSPGEREHGAEPRKKTLRGQSAEKRCEAAPQA